jgi:kojibiose phosphorylase
MYDPESSPTVQRQDEALPADSTTQALSTSVRQSILVTGGVGTAELTRDRDWLLVEEGFTLGREHEVESLFAIGNGYLGNRGSLAEGSPLSAPATFVAGVFESDASRPSSVPGLFVVPDWTGVRAWIADQPLSMEQGQVLDHRRILDMRLGILWREWRHRDPNGRITRVIGFRLASLADRHLLAQSVILTPENYSAELRLETSIEVPPNVVASPPPDEWKTRRDAMRPNVLPLALRSPGRDVTVAFGAASQLACDGHDTGRREIDLEDRRTTERFEVRAEIGVEYRLDRFVSVYTSRDVVDPTRATIDHVNSVLPDGVQQAVKNHAEAWHQRWHDADVVVAVDDALQRELRFAEYHLITAANPEDERVSIGARALTGEAYKGHVFWDAEIYMVPFYSLTHPPSARALLMYRYHLLEAAREKARAAGYRGAMFPWESADTGEETTPRFVIDPKGQVIEVLNGDMENHITCDVAYAVWQYWQTTGDDGFFVSAGAELMLETARFWASRGHEERDGLYHIHRVIGPDEYHDNVDDNAFTNVMASWNMKRGVETAHMLAERWPQKWQELVQRLQITREEVDSWAHLADIVFTGFDPETKLFEQFKGYFKKEPVDLMSYEPRSSAMDVILGHERIQQTNVVKQADVVMLLYLLWDQFPNDVRLANFRYYEPRTGHGSSLSPSMHALMAARLGEMASAEKYLRQAAEVDLGNNMGNAAGGVHAAAIGGLWQAVVFGFAGVELAPDSVRFDPHLLSSWRRITFPMQWRRRKLRVTMEHDTVRIIVEEGDQALKVAMVKGEQVQAQPHRQYLSRRRNGAWGEWQETQA